MFQPYVNVGSGREPFSEYLEKTPNRMGLPIGEPTCYAKEASTGHRCYVGQPDEDEAGTEGVRVYINTYRRSGPSRETADIEGWCQQR